MTGPAPMSAATLRAQAGRRARRLEYALHRRLLRFPSRVRCPICGWHGVRFGPAYRPRRPNRFCPGCGSSERYRAFELVMRRRGPVAPGTRLLEIAPVEAVRRTAESMGYTYLSVDLDSTGALVHADLTAMPFPDASFDTVVCFHVMEHIVDDAAAVRELARLVGTEGKAFVVVPRDEARPETFEVPAETAAERERLFGQHDHVRMYGADVADRWRAAGVAVTEDPWRSRFTIDVHEYAALTGNDDRFWIVSQQA